MSKSYDSILLEDMNTKIPDLHPQRPFAQKVPRSAGNADVVRVGLRVGLKIDTILEIVAPMNRRLIKSSETFKHAQRRRCRIKKDMEVIKFAIKTTNDGVRNHEHRITALKAA